MDRFFGLAEQGTLAAAIGCALAGLPANLPIAAAGALPPGLAGIVLTFFLVDLPDHARTLIATSHRAGLMRPDGAVPRIGPALMADSGSAMTGTARDAPATVSHVEGAAGVQAAGEVHGAVWLIAALSAVTFALT